MPRFFVKSSVLVVPKKQVRNMPEHLLEFLIPSPLIIECPDYGNLKILPYVSSGAMDVFIHNQHSPTTAFEAVLGATIEDDDGKEFPSHRLSIADKTFIAMVLMKSLNSADRFQQLLADMDVANAFHTALVESEEFKETLASHNRIQKYFERESRFHQLATQSIGAIQKSMRLTALVDSTLFLKADFQRFARQNSMIERLAIRHQSMSGSLELATSHLAGIQREANRFSAMHRSFVSSSHESFSHLKSLALALPPTIDAFHALKSRIRLNDFSLETITTTSKAIEAASVIVQSTNEYFGRRRLPTIAPAGSEYAEDIAEIEQSEIESRFLLYEESRDLVLLGNDTVELVASRIAETAENLIENKFKPYRPLLDRMNLLAQPMSFLDVLHDFANLIRQGHGKRFWKEKGETFIASPEALANSLLSMYLSGRWHGVGFVGYEIGNGDGFMDIFVQFLGTNYIVELKLVGPQWSIGHVENGLAQIDQYMANYGDRESYLVVFDGRKTNTGRKLQPKYSLNHGDVHVVTIPIHFVAPTQV